MSYKGNVLFRVYYFPPYKSPIGKDRSNDIPFHKFNEKHYINCTINFFSAFVIQFKNVFDSAEVDELHQLFDQKYTKNSN